MLYHVIPLPIPTACLRTTKTTFDCYKCLQFTTVPFELPLSAYYVDFLLYFSIFYPWIFQFSIHTSYFQLFYSLSSIIYFQLSISSFISIFYFLFSTPEWYIDEYSPLNPFHFPFPFPFLLSFFFPFPSHFFMFIPKC